MYRLPHWAASAWRLGGSPDLHRRIRLGELACGGLRDHGDAGVPLALVAPARVSAAIQTLGLAIGRPVVLTACLGRKRRTPRERVLAGRPLSRMSPEPGGGERQVRTGIRDESIFRYGAPSDQAKSGSACKKVRVAGGAQGMA